MQLRHWVTPECVILQDGIHGALFSNSEKIQIFSFKKIHKKYQSVVNELVYMCLNFHHEIPCIQSSVKITTLQIRKHEQYHFQIF
jgi:glutathionylspermidine synthase